MCFVLSFVASYLNFSQPLGAEVSLPQITIFTLLLTCAFLLSLLLEHDTPLKAMTFVHHFEREGLVVGCKKSRVWRINLKDD